MGLTKQHLEALAQAIENKLQSTLNQKLISTEDTEMNTEEHTTAPEITQLLQFMNGLSLLANVADNLSDEFYSILDENQRLTNRNAELSQQLTGLQKAYDAVVKNQFIAVGILHKNDLLLQYITETSEVTNVQKY